MLRTWTCLVSTCILPAVIASTGASVLAFDYVIVGGGTAGLVVANRLSALPNVSVAIIEVGGDQRQNPNVTSANGFSLAFDTPVDWAYRSVPQASSGDRVIEYHAGKAIGGTSTINGMTYVRAQKAQIDAWESIGNPGWNWETLFPYYKKAEHFDLPTPAQVAVGASYIPGYHGDTGPLHVGYQYELQNGSFYGTVRETWRKLGQQVNKDVNGGDVHGFDVWPKTCVRDLDLRADAAQAYYWPVAGRPNLRLVQGTATRIHWKDSGATASGVEYITSASVTSTLLATREVILSAGSLRTPALLELSGVGNPKILSQHGIETKVALPGVGEHLQDQPNVLLAYTGRTNITVAPYATFTTMHELFGTDVGPAVRANLTAWAASISAASNGAVSAHALERLFALQARLIFDQAVPSTELLTSGQGSIIYSAIWPLLPFSRGSVHIQSADATQPPAIDPRFFLVDFDLQATLAAARLVQRFWATQPVADLVVAQLLPAAAIITPNATDAEWAEYIISAFASNYHPIGTAAMMSRELGGVVDPTLKVYGTSNVRVVDASVLPMQVSGHLTSTIYAVAERAADIVKATL